MINRITTGGDTAGLMRYLVGPGEANEHTNPHVVAGSPDIQVMWGGRVRELDPRSAVDVANDLDYTMRGSHTVPEGKRTQWNKEAGEYVTTHGANHVWHCSLSLRKDMGELGDETWGNIARDFISEMGIADGDVRTDCQWVAIRHGKSKNGNDHIHLVVNRVQADGRVWDTYKDFKKASKATTRIEQKYGLEVLESRTNGRGAIHDSANELNAARAHGNTQTYRADLEVRVRAAATAAANEADFVSQLHDQGLRCRPYFEKGRTDIISGYSVALPDSQVPKEITSPWRAATKIAKDLGLKDLRTRWEDTPTSALEAAEAWRGVWHSNANEWKNRPLTEGELHAQATAAKAFSDRLKHVDPTDPIQLANASSDIAGALAAIAANPDAGRVAWQIRSLSRRVAHNAQLNMRPADKDIRFPASKFATRLLMVAAASKNDTARASMMIASVVELVVELAALYRAANQASTAARLEQLANESIRYVHESYSDNPWLAAIGNTTRTHTAPDTRSAEHPERELATVGATPRHAANTATQVRPGTPGSAQTEPNQMRRADVEEANPWLEEPSTTQTSSDEPRHRTETSDAADPAEQRPTQPVREPNPWLDEPPSEPSRDAQPPTNKDFEKRLDTLNPTGSITTEYDPEFQAQAPLGENLVPLSTIEDLKPDDPVTIYRGVPSDAGDQINAGDYADTGKVIEQQVPASHVLDDADEPGGEEYIHRPESAAETTTQDAAAETLDDSLQADPSLNDINQNEWPDDLDDNPWLNDTRNGDRTSTATQDDSPTNSATIQDATGPNPWLDRPNSNISPAPEEEKVDVERAAAEIPAPPPNLQAWHAWAVRAAEKHDSEDANEYADDVRQVLPNTSEREQMENWAHNKVNTPVDHDHGQMDKFARIAQTHSSGRRSTIGLHDDGDGPDSLTNSQSLTL